MPILGRNTRKIHLISYNFMGKHAFWMASFQCLAKSLLPLKWIVHDTCIPLPSQYLFPYFWLFTSTNPITWTPDNLTFSDFPRSLELSGVLDCIWYQNLSALFHLGFSPKIQYNNKSHYLTYACLICPRTSPVGIRTVIAGPAQGQKTGQLQLAGCSSSIIQLPAELLITFM